MTTRSVSIGTALLIAVSLLGEVAVAPYFSERAKEGQFPSAVGLVSQGEYIFCSGVLIAPNVVLTAASCVCNRNVSALQVIAGELIPDKYLSDFMRKFWNERHRDEPASATSPTMQIRNATRAIVEPHSLAECQKEKGKAIKGLNVALLRLNQSFSIDGKLVGVAAVDYSNRGQGQNLTMVGFGAGPVLNNQDLRYAFTKTQGSCKWHLDNWIYAGRDRLDNLICSHRKEVGESYLYSEDIGGGLFAADGRTLIGVSSATQKSMMDDSIFRLTDKILHPGGWFVTESYFVGVARVRTFIEESLVALTVAS